jgi:glycosyltransferase involved in cell wall biosynthesis
MNILFLPKWYPNKNDIQNGIFIKNQALALSNYAQVAVLFVITSEKVKKEEIEIVKNQNYFEITGYFPKRKNRVLALFSYYKLFKKAKLKLEQEWGRPDVVNLYILGRNYMMYKKFWQGIPFVVSEQWSGYMNGGFENYIYAKRKNTTNALKKAEKIIAVSKPLADALHKYSGRNDIQIIPNIVYPGKITENKITDSVNVLTVADLDDSIKDISGMLHVLKIVSKEFKIHFTVIGEGKDEIKLKNLASSLQNNAFQTEFKGRMPHAKVINAYCHANFYFLNSPSETFCVAAAESIASGRPVLSTRCGGPEEFINEKNGIFFTGSDDFAKAEKVKEMIRKMNENFFPANALSGEFGQLYGADTVAKQYLSVFEASNNKK